LCTVSTAPNPTTALCVAIVFDTPTDVMVLALTDPTTASQLIMTKNMIAWQTKLIKVKPTIRLSVLLCPVLTISVREVKHWMLRSCSSKNSGIFIRYLWCVNGHLGKIDGKNRGERRRYDGENYTKEPQKSEWWLRYILEVFEGHLRAI